MSSDALRQCDVLVIGSGGAALSAALRAASAGLSVLIIEKSSRPGGTTAMSGGATWVPANHHAREAGIEDSPAEVLTYLKSSAPQGWSETELPLWRAFAASAGEMLQFIETHTPLRFALTMEADPLLTNPGAKEHGRMLAPQPLRAWHKAGARWRLPPTPLPRYWNYHEILSRDIWRHPFRETLRMSPCLLWRALTGVRTKGAALITGLLDGCLRYGCQLETNAHAIKLRTTGRRVTGAYYSQCGRLTEVRVSKGVVLACGGFEWDALRRAEHFPGVFDFIASPDSNTGDGHRMAEAIGAQLAHMDQANISGGIPAAKGTPHGLSVYFHYEPNVILVNRFGERFVNEFTFNLGEALDERDASGQPRQLPVWLIADADLLRRAPLLRYYAWRKPGWMRTAPDLKQLAHMVGLPETTLAASITRFNQLCRKGEDDDFGRHMTLMHGVGDNRFRGGMQAIARAPFIAIPFNRTFLATKGGPRTDEYGRVRHRDGTVIEGLYCAGVAMANPIGTRAIGAGTTLGPNLTWGFICGRSLAEGVPDTP